MDIKTKLLENGIGAVSDIKDLQHWSWRNKGAIENMNVINKFTSTDLMNGNGKFGPCTLATRRVQFTNFLSVMN